MLVATESRVGRKEMMWERRESGRSLIMSVLVVKAFRRAVERRFLCFLSLLFALSGLSILSFLLSQVSQFSASSPFLFNMCVVRFMGILSD